MVTSLSNTALFVQCAGIVAFRVGAVVFSGMGVRVAGTNPALVGANVAVTKFGPAGVAVSMDVEMPMQAVSRLVNRKIKVIFLIIVNKFYLDNTA
jgi:hypothetical protein